MRPSRLMQPVVESPELGVVAVATGSLLDVVAIDVVGAADVVGADAVVDDAVVAGLVVGEVLLPPLPLLPPLVVLDPPDEPEDVEPAADET